MALTPDLLALVRNLRQVRSPVKRMQVLVKAWRSFKGLSLAERREVASHLGLEGFERVAGMIGEKGGVAPEELEAILRKVEEVEPSKASALIARLRDPAGRREMARGGVAALGAWLARGGDSAAGGGEGDDEDPAGGEGGEPGAEPAESGSEQIMAGGPEKSSRASPRKSASAVASPTGLHEAAHPAPAAPPGEPPPSRPPTLSAGPEIPVVRPEESRRPHEPEPKVMAAPQGPIASPVAAPSPERGADPWSVGSRRSGPESAPPGDPASPGGEVEAAIERIGAIRSPVRRLKALRDLVAALGPLDGAEAAALIDLFPEGWCRRRALSSLLMGGSPRAFDDALAAAMEISGGDGRRWALAALARGRALEPGDLDRLCEAAASPVLARSLRRLQAARTGAPGRERNSPLGGSA